MSELESNIPATATGVAPAEQAVASPLNGEATVEEVTPQRPPLSDEHRAAIAAAVEASGPAAVFNCIAEGSNDLALTALNTGNRKQVLFAMKLGQVASRAGEVVSKAEERMNKKRKGKGAASDDDDEEDDDVIE